MFLSLWKVYALAPAAWQLTCWLGSSFLTTVRKSLIITLSVSPIPDLWSIGFLFFFFFLLFWKSGAFQQAAVHLSRRGHHVCFSGLGAGASTAFSAEHMNYSSPPPDEQNSISPSIACPSLRFSSCSPSLSYAYWTSPSLHWALMKAVWEMMF